MYLLSQGSWLKVFLPPKLVIQMKLEIKKMLNFVLLITAI